MRSVEVLFAHWVSVFQSYIYLCHYLHWYPATKKRNTATFLWTLENVLAYWDVVRIQTVDLCTVVWSVDNQLIYDYIYQQALYLGKTQLRFPNEPIGDSIYI